MSFLKNTLLLVPFTMVAVGCGEWEKNPVPNLDEYRKEAREATQQGTPQPRVITKEIVVVQSKEVTKEQATIDEKLIVITPDADMNFNEGKESKFNVRARVLVKGATIALKAEGLPEGATLVQSETDKELYVLSWTPKLYTLRSNEVKKSFNVKFTAQVTSAPSEAELAKLKAVLRTKEVSVLLFRNEERPSQLTVQGLSNEISEGTLTPFTVTVKVPGIDGSATQKPTLEISYDGKSLTNGNNFLELDGTRHVVRDLKQREAEYLGDSMWKFFLTFDTKNISVQPQISKDGTFMLNATGTRVRLSFKVYNNGLATDSVLSQIKIKLAEKPTTPETTEAAQ